MSCVYDMQKKARQFELASCSSLLLGRDGGLEAVTRDGRGGTESGALRCLRVQVVKRKQISATDGTRAGVGGYRSLAEVAKRGSRIRVAPITLLCNVSLSYLMMILILKCSHRGRSCLRKYAERMMCSSPIALPSFAATGSDAQSPCVRVRARARSSSARGSRGFVRAQQSSVPVSNGKYSEYRLIMIWLCSK